MANPNPSPATRFKPGADWTGNALGRPPGESFASVLRIALEAQHRHAPSWRHALVAKAVLMAEKGDLDALKWIADRTDGKVKDESAHEHSGKVEIEVTYSRRDPDLPGPAGTAPGPGADQA